MHKPIEQDYALRHLTTGQLTSLCNRREEACVPLRFHSPILAEGYAYYLHGRMWIEILEIILIDAAVDQEVAQSADGEMNA